MFVVRWWGLFCRVFVEVVIECIGSLRGLRMGNVSMSRLVVPAEEILYLPWVSGGTGVVDES